MSTRQYYITPSGLPPNGGVPPGVSFLGRTPGDTAPPPAYGSAPVLVSTSLWPAFLAAAAAGTAPSTVPTPSPTPASAPPAFEPPGTRLNGEKFVKDGKAYLFPAQHSTVHFFHEGHRPFEDPDTARSNLPFQAYQVSVSTTVADLIRLLGFPHGIDGATDRFGVTECVEAADSPWKKGTTYVVSQDRSKKTLQELGWGVEKPVWIAVFDAEKHHP